MEADAAGRARRWRAAPRLAHLPRGFLAFLLVPPLLLVVAHLLPAEGLGLAVRLLAAGTVVFLLPGAVVQRALGWPDSLGLALAGSLAWSLVVVFVAFAATFAVGGGIWTATLVFAALPAALLLPALRRQRAAAPARADLLAVAGLAAAGLLLGVLVWWVSTNVHGDALFHLARVRKLAELDDLSSVRVVGEFSDGALHPGYAFPLWHGALALVSLFAGVDPTLVVLHVASLLVPLALVLSYAAGAALFGTWAGGVATAVAHTAIVALTKHGSGVFEFLGLPATASTRLLLPALLALFFAYAASGGKAALASLGAATFALTVIHPTYVGYTVVLLLAYTGARVVLGRGEREELRRTAAGLGTVVLAAGLFALWLLPVLRETSVVRPSEAVQAREIRIYDRALDLSGDEFNLKPGAVARGGAAVVAALLAVPLAALAARRRWAALVLGGSVVTLAILLVPQLFTSFSDAVSLGQSRRLGAFVPLAFALAGAAALLGRLRLVGCAAALALGLGLFALFPNDPTASEEFSLGPSWPPYVALLGGAVALVVASVRRPSSPLPGAWAAAAIALLVAPSALAGLADPRRNPPDRLALTPGLVTAVNRLVAPRATVFSDLETSYRIAAYAPVYIAASPPAHVIETRETRPYQRRRDVLRFFTRASPLSDGERRAILRRYGAEWLIVRLEKPYPQGAVRRLEQVYADGRYALYRVPQDGER